MLTNLIKVRFRELYTKEIRKLSNWCQGIEQAYPHDKGYSCNQWPHFERDFIGQLTSTPGLLADLRNFAVSYSEVDSESFDPDNFYLNCHICCERRDEWVAFASRQGIIRDFQFSNLPPP